MSDGATGPRRSPGKEYVLVVHSDSPAHRVMGVRVRVEERGKRLLLRYVVDGAEHVALPDQQIAARTDGLWKTTCCEMFLASVGSDGYFEFNYSPSKQWAAYRFAGYRAGASELPQISDPQITGSNETSANLVEVEQDLSAVPSGPLQMGLSAVIEETDGTKSYWALAHAPGPPDFHNRDCFTATLAAPSGA